MREIEQSKAVLESRYESRLNQFQHLNESLDASGMIESHEAELDKLRTTQVFIKRKYTWSNNMQTDTSSSIYMFQTSALVEPWVWFRYGKKTFVWNVELVLLPLFFCFFPSLITKLENVSRGTKCRTTICNPFFDQFSSRLTQFSRDFLFYLNHVCVSSNSSVLFL